MVRYFLRDGNNCRNYFLNLTDDQARLLKELDECGLLNEDVVIEELTDDAFETI